jgi:hypothetical protein
MQRNAIATTSAIAPLDLTPTGRVPAIVAAAAERPDAGAVDAALRKVAPEQYTPELAARIAQGAAVQLNEGPCPVYRDCVDTTPGHYDHFNHGIKVVDDEGATVLDAGMAALSGTDSRPVVYLRNTDYNDAASVHAATAQLRALLDQVDAMADRVFADHKTRG